MTVLASNRATRRRTTVRRRTVANHSKSRRTFPAAYSPVPIARLSVEQYHRMLDAAILEDGDPIELLEGWMIPKDAADDLPRDSLPAEDSPDIPPAPVWRLTVRQYHQMLEAEILHSGDRIELLEGWLVPKMTKNPPHMVACELLSDALRSLVPSGWFLKFEAPLSLSDSEPEPDLAIVRGTSRDYIKGHPSSKQVGLVVEVADASRLRDLGLKKRLYARSRIVEYWVVNLSDARVEVFREPSGPTAHPDYRQHQIFTARQRIPLTLDGKKCGTVLVSSVLP